MTGRVQLYRRKDPHGMRRRLVPVLAAAVLGCGNSATYIPLILTASTQQNFGTVVTAGAPTVFLTGLFFSPDMTVTWNGRRVPVTVASGTQAEIQLDPAIDDPVAGTASLLATSGDKTSELLQVRIVDATLAVSGVSPQEIDPGSPATTLSISGNGFRPGAQVLWNGAALPTTLVAGTLLQAQVPASDLAAAGEAIVEISMPGCNPQFGACQIAAPVVSVGASSKIVVPGPFDDVVSDETHGKLYLAGGGAIEPLDLASARLGVPAALPSPVNQVFISDQDRFLYAFAPFHGGVRLTLPDLSGAQGAQEGQFLSALAPVPGAPASFAFCTNGFVGVSDGDTVRPNLSAPFSASSLVFGSDASTLFALGNGIFVVRLDASGVSSITPLTVRPLRGSSIRYDRTTRLVYTSHGEVFDESGAVHPLSSIVAANPACDAAVLDGALGRMFFVCFETGLGLTVRSFDVATQEPLARIRLPVAGQDGPVPQLSSFRMVRFGIDGLAVIAPDPFRGTDGALVVYRGPFVH